MSNLNLEIMKKQVESTKRTPEQVKADAVKTVNKSIREKKEAQKDPEPSKPEPTKATPKPAKKKKSTRTIIVCDVLRKLPQPTTIEDAAKTVDTGFVKAGGNSNVKQTIHLIKVLLPAAVEWGIVEQVDGKLKTC